MAPPEALNARPLARRHVDDHAASAIFDVEFTCQSPGAELRTLGDDCKPDHRPHLLLPLLLRCSGGPRWRRIQFQLIREGLAYRKCDVVDRLSSCTVCPGIIEPGMWRETIRPPYLSLDLFSGRINRKPGSTERYRSIAPTALDGLGWPEAALKGSDVSFRTTAVPRRTRLC